MNEYPSDLKDTIPPLIIACIIVPIIILLVNIGIYFKFSVWVIIPIILFIIIPIISILITFLNKRF